MTSASLEAVSPRSTTDRTHPRIATAALSAVLVAAALFPLDATQSNVCLVSGRSTSGTTALPGVSIVVRAGADVKAVTSTDVDGTYRLSVPPGDYTIAAELAGFVTLERPLALASIPCATSLDLPLTLAPRTSRATAPPETASGRGAAPAAAPRFETLALEAPAAGAAGIDVNPPERENAAAALLLPPGFSTDGPTQSLAITGNMATLDRGMMGERLEAINRGEFDPVTGEFAPGFGPGQGGGPGGRGGPGGMGPGGPGRGGPGGPGGEGFLMGGRGRGQNAYNVQSNYSFGGSALDASPYQLRADAPVNEPPYTRQTFGVTVGGPLRIPGVYNGTRRTTFTASYGGTRGDSLFDQFATVPTDSLRSGDFSGVAAPIVDPLTGEPFAGNQIPSSRIDPSTLALLRFIPAPNLPGVTRNYHYTTTADSVSDNVTVRVNHAFTQAAGGRGGRGGGGGGGRIGGPGRGGRGAEGTSVMMNAQVQYRRNDNEQVGLPLLGGHNAGSSLALPLSFNIVHRRTMHNVSVNYSRTSSAGVNRYAYVEDVAGNAGITGVATDPFDWGVPQLSFASFSSVRDLTPSRRTDTRTQVAYSWTRPFAAHTLRAGGDVRFDRSSNQTDNNARGAFVFTGLYASGGNAVVRNRGIDFADFLLGLPQQATVQYGPGDVRMSGNSMSLYLQDDWRRSASLTVNLGVRYELLLPFTEQNGHMVNLDAAPDFSAVTPVYSGGTGPYSGSFPDALVATDANNIAPRVGLAWRVRPGTIVRGGYGISFNSGSYSTIARQLVGQPPWAVTNASIGTLDDPLRMAAPFAGASPTETTNNYGVARDYALGVVQTWNADVSRDIARAWNVGASYTHTRGSSLDMIRAPNRGPDGLRIEGVDPFLWQTSEGSSVLHAGTFRIRRRPVAGLGGGATYTLARSRDNASSLGGGGTTVAQDDQNLEAEWGLSSFDRRHQLAADVSLELPFGPNRPWLNQGGTWAALLRDWRVTTAFTWQSGTPFTAQVRGAVSDVARGTNGTLRANYTGAEIQLRDPTIDRFFNTTAFFIPPAGTFGNSGRNIIIGPGSRQLNAQLARDVRLGGNRALTLQVTATNLLNTVNYGTIDTVVNSPTFGQVMTVRGMRSTQLNLRFRF